ncbi:hypothetical protein GCM10022243_10450 [Saccharothrix violaceirubra]|uniref:PucR C-terminal helix-turn-helix domain-containing protein n=1 Tax=Saccharothrix violaceirubra TaxID=413306 RepID=A0A7W7T3X1_9PSEU|nr:PucR family transcriptional regulator [Saccharothrix violaceirubra]MBB4966115.1 hypothetical protein [Saccharothrix violaceirubra]
MAVDAYQREIPDFRRIATRPDVRESLLDFAVYLRRRTIELIADDEPFSRADIGLITAMGRARGAKGVSPASQRQVLVLHTSLLLREVHEIAGPDDGDAVMSALHWLPELGAASHSAYTTGYLGGLADARPLVDRVLLLAEALVTDDPLAHDLAAHLAMPVPRRCLVVVVRLPRSDVPRSAVADLLARHWVPCGWTAADELTAVVDGRDRGLAFVRDFVAAVDVPCSIGAAHGEVGALSEVAAGAREVSRVAPPRTAIHLRDDLFAELGVSRVPAVDAWLRDVADRLARGPRLVGTLDAFYRNDMARSRTAAALGVHPRTLDYRLRRVEELTGIDPVTVRGVRILSTAVNRVLAEG